MYYRDMLAQDVKNVEVWNLLRLANDYLPRYYDSRGFRVVLEGVSARLSSLLRT